MTMRHLRVISVRARPETVGWSRIVAPIVSGRRVRVITTAWATVAGYALMAFMGVTISGRLYPIPVQWGRIASTLAAAIGPQKSLLLDPVTRRSTGIIEQAHALGMQVHPWTFRDEAVRPAFATVREEMLAYFEAGIDGGFSDFPDTAMAVRDEYVANV